jgi:peptidoglycan/LPS O-acetylase OafA/YrhL
MNKLSNPQGKLRDDIQALRGFAVLLVVFYHAKLSFLSAGYLGVDIFFVISGFLITRMIKEGIEKGSFRFSDFYFRRAKRLLPAAYVTFLVTALLAPLFLTSSELRDFRAQLAGAVTFTGNIALWRQSGYFEGAAELKPLLHVWSLAIEEQYYFLLPAMLVLIPRRFWLGAGVAIFVASLVLCLVMVQTEAAATFYLLPTRAWELTIGSIGALMASGDRLGRFLKLAFWPALAVLVVLPFAPIGSYHPGPDALLICLATLVLILRKHPLLSERAAMRRLSKIGDISYSLYLVHWPLFAVFNNIWISDPGNEQPLGIRVGLIGLSLLLAYLLNRYVEEPMRRLEVRNTARALGRAIAASLGLVLVTSGVTHAGESAKDYAQIRRVNHGFNVACAFKTDFAPIPECRNSEKPEMLIWGDSFAMHLVPGILGSGSNTPPVVQATRPVCGPLLGVAPINDMYKLAWAESCLAFNKSVVSYLQETDSIKTVVLSSPFSQFVDKEGHLLKRDERDGTHRIVDAGVVEAVQGLKRTVDAVRALGKRVVVVSPPPASGFDIGRCTERLETELPILGVNHECRIDVNAYRKERAAVLEFLAALPQKAGVQVISFDSYLCDSGTCRTYVDGTFIYRDRGHLSHEGSVFMANAVSLVEKINQVAR